MNRLLILAPNAAEYYAFIDAAGLQQLEIFTASDVETASAVVASCNIIMGAPDLIRRVLDKAERLEWVQSAWAGVNHLCSPSLRRDYTLTGVKDVFGPQISEYVSAYLFALERRMFRMRGNQFEQRWQPYPYRPSRDIRLGIIGLGSIGGHLAQTIRNFGIRVTGMNRSGRPCDDVEKVYTPDQLEEFLGDLDYVVLTLPDTPRTRHFIDADALRMMKSSAVLMNVGRGRTVKQDDLIRALQEGVIKGAVLDVFEKEPLPPDSPLWKLPNAYLTPHDAALSFPEDIAGIFIRSYERFLRREPLLNIVDFEKGY